MGAAWEEVDGLLSCQEKKTLDGLAWKDDIFVNLYKQGIVQFQFLLEGGQGEGRTVL